MLPSVAVMLAAATLTESSLTFINHHQQLVALVAGMLAGKVRGRAASF